MQCFTNDLSLDGQFASPLEFRSAIEPLLALRMKDSCLRQNLFCSSLLSGRPVTTHHNFRQAVFALKDPNFRSLILNWITKQGPFWDDNRYFNPDDYFEFQATDVTDQGLGEAARRHIAGVDAATFSFTGSRLNFEKTPLQVQHGLAEAPIAWVEILNTWNIEELKTKIKDARPDPANWLETMDYVQHDFPELIFSRDPIIAQLKRHPFSKYLVQRIFELLRVLNTIATETNRKGGLTEKGGQLLAAHFVGEKAWFTDESSTNKHKFKKKLTFSDPETPENQLFCSWHGKIKAQQFRIHFAWPRPSGQTKIKVVYIGPKITKN